MDREIFTARLASFWTQEIPLARAMQASIDTWDGKCLTVSAALAPNRNHRGTAFGGSLYSLAVLAGWGLIMLRLWQDDHDGDVVIQHAEVDYLSPVRGALVARCCVEEEAWREFARTLDRRGKARLRLQLSVAGEAEAALRMRADFVATARR